MKRIFALFITACVLITTAPSLTSCENLLPLLINGESATLDEETNPDGDVTDPDEDVTAPDEDVTAPDEDVTGPDEDVTGPDEDVTGPDEDVTDPDEDVTDPDEDVTDPDEDVTDPDEDVTDPDEDTVDEIISSLVHIESRPDFAFRSDLTNKTVGESSPINSDYYLSAYKVTNAQYAVFISETSHKAPSYWKNGTYPEGKADHPVLNISYSDAVSYCEWLSSKYEDWTFRLPSEAEWENAAMGVYYGNNTVKYPNAVAPSYSSVTGELSTTFNFNAVIASALLREYGSDYVVTYIKGDFAGTSETLGECISISAGGGVSNWANHGSEATKGYFLQTDLYATISANGGNTTPVDAYAPNSLGLYDMAGNCWDITASLIVAENGLEKGETCYAVRGGSWYATARSCTFSYRGEGRKDFPSSTVGFRVAADYTPQKK